MSFRTQSSKCLFAVALAVSASSCDEPAEEGAATPSAKPVASAAPTPVSTQPPAPKPPPQPREDCPEGSTGIGTFDEPCVGSEGARMLDIQYTGKTTEQGPKFSVTNKTKRPILHGSIAVYFYDKAGKQLQVTALDPPAPKRSCSGNIFAGQVNPDEKIYVFFSCVKAKHIPEGTKTIEAEAYMVGFADETGKQNEFYWKNQDLVPDERPKGGVKFKAKPKKK